MPFAAASYYQLSSVLLLGDQRLSARDAVGMLTCEQIVVLMLQKVHLMMMMFVYESATVKTTTNYNSNGYGAPIY